MAKTELPAEIKKLSFEDALEQLEKIVDGLETGEGALDDAIQSYARGAQIDPKYVPAKDGMARTRGGNAA